MYIKNNFVVISNHINFTTTLSTEIPKRETKVNILEKHLHLTKKIRIVFKIHG